MTGRRDRRRAAERGSALVELTWLGVLLLIPLGYVMLTVATAQRHAYGVTAAARSAGRAFVLAPDVAAARQRALAAAQLALRDQGLTLHPADLAITCQPTPADCLQPGSSVHVTVRVDVRLPLVPTVLGRQPATIAVDATHTEVYGTYRDAAP